jgi:hypothetical protein
MAKTLTPSFDLGCRTTVGIRGFGFYNGHSYLIPQFCIKSGLQRKKNGNEC